MSITVDFNSKEWKEKLFEIYSTAYSLGYGSTPKHDIRPDFEKYYEELHRDYERENYYEQMESIKPIKFLQGF